MAAASTAASDYGRSLSAATCPRVPMASDVRPTCRRDRTGLGAAPLPPCFQQPSIIER